MVKNDRQEKGTGMLFQGHPFVGQHNASAAVYLYKMMIVVHQFFCLLTRADRDPPMRIYLIEGCRHPQILSRVNPQAAMA